MPKKLDSLPCQAIGQDVPARAEDEEKQEDLVKANEGFGSVGFVSKLKFVSR